jgi:hypothetical protein
MPNVLRNRLNELASQFATSVLSAIRGASLEELLAETGSGAHLALALPTARGRGLDGALPRATFGGKGARALGGRLAGGRLARRSPDQIAGVVERIVGLLKQNPRGLRAEQIRTRLGLLAKEMPRPLKDALAAGRIGKSGQKRSTLYFVKGGGAAVAKGPGPKKAVPRAGRKARKASAASGARRAGRRPKAKARRARSAAPSRARRKASRPKASRGNGGKGRGASKRASLAKRARAVAAPPPPSAPAPAPAA